MAVPVLPVGIGTRLHGPSASWHVRDCFSKQVHRVSVYLDLSSAKRLLTGTYLVHASAPWPVLCKFQARDCASARTCSTSFSTVCWTCYTPDRATVVYGGLSLNGNFARELAGCFVAGVGALSQ